MPRIAYEFVTTEGRWLGRQEVRRGRKRVWKLGDELTTEAPRGRFTTWRVVDVEGLRVVATDRRSPR